MTEYKQCRLCKGKNGKVAPPGYISSFVENAETGLKNEVLKECTCHKEWRAENELLCKISRAGLRPDLIKYRPLDYVGTKSRADFDRLCKYVWRRNDLKESEEVLRKLEAACLYLYGPNGTQKTTAANYAGIEFLRSSKSVRYYLMNDLIKLLQKADRDEAALALIECLADIDVLIIDEAFDKEKLTLYKSGWQLPFLDTFLRNRISKGKGIIFISNVLPTDIAANGFSKSIQDFVERNLIINKGLLEFNDNYIANATQIDVEELF